MPAGNYQPKNLRQNGFGAAFLDSCRFFFWFGFVAAVREKNILIGALWVLNYYPRFMDNAGSLGLR
jgi:hypothetical protein